MDRFIETHKFQLGPHIAENVVPSLTVTDKPAGRTPKKGRESRGSIEKSVTYFSSADFGEETWVALCVPKKRQRKMLQDDVE